MTVLAAALENLSDRPGAPWEEVDPWLAHVFAAACRQVPLEPVPCETCGGRGSERAIGPDCQTCDGTGWTYQPGTVEAVKAAIYGTVDLWITDYSALVPIVLDALRALADQEVER